MITALILPTCTRRPPANSALFIFQVSLFCFEFSFGRAAKAPRCTTAVFGPSLSLSQPRTPRRCPYHPTRCHAVFRKRARAHQVLGEAVRARTAIPRFVLPLKFLVVLASSIGGDRLCLKGIVSLCRPPPQDQGRARAAGNRFARDDKVPGPQLGAKQLPGERPRESAETRHTSTQPSRHVRKKAPPRLAPQKSRPHAHLGPMRCAPAYFLCKWGI